MLDVGSGDGRITAAVLSPATERVDLVEPSAVLLATAVESFADVDVDVGAHALGVGEFLRGPAREASWDLTMSTFALHALEPRERSNVLAELATRSGRLVIVEFDVPRYEDRSAEHAAYVTDRYAKGLLEYADEPEVISGFLMPVLVGQFDPNQARHTYEQPIQDWVGQLQGSGWTVNGLTSVTDYWWAPAVLIDAQADDVSGERTGAWLKS